MSDIRRGFHRGFVNPTRVATAVCCVALLVLAGCSALPGTDAADGEPYTEAGEPLNATALQSDHRSNVRAAGSFTVVAESSSAVGTSSSEGRTVAAVDLEDDRVRQDANYRTTVAGGTERTAASNTTIYRANGTIYARTIDTQGNRSTTQYQVIDAAETPANLSARFAGLQAWMNVVRGANWTQQGTERRDGTTVTRYTANGSDDFDTAALDDRASTGAQSPEVAGFNATLLVTSDGTIRLLTYDVALEARGQRVAAENRVTVESIGETSVREPGWLDEARNASGADA